MSPQTRLRNENPRFFTTYMKLQGFDENVVEWTFSYGGSTISLTLMI